MDGMGWLGWSYDQTINTPMPVIELAMRGLYERLAAIHGGGSSTPPVPAEPPSSAAVMAVFRAAANRPK